MNCGQDSAGRPCLYEDPDCNPVTGNRPVLALCFGGDNSWSETFYTEFYSTLPREKVFNIN